MLDPIAHAVFISYARDTSRAHAEALHQALGGKEGVAFLDSANMHDGERWPDRLMDALLAARAVVLFAEGTYFQRRYCWREFRAALAPFLLAQARPGTSDAEKAAALAGLVVARPVVGSLGLEHLPPLLQNTQWPRADDTQALATLVRSVLEKNGPTLGERLRAFGATAREICARLLEELVLEPPSRLAADQRLYPAQQPESLGTAFVGRADDLWRIDSSLRAEANIGGPRTVALHGGGGVGKTRLALEYLHRYGRHYPGGIFWVDADASEGRLEEQLHGILRVLLPGTPDLPLFLRQHRSVTDELAQALQAVPAHQPILYVVDNLPEPEGGQPPRPLKTWCPGRGKVSLLVTSRVLIAERSVTAQPVEPLTPESAVTLLTHTVQDQTLGQQGWNDIAHWVGHLPLALELLNSALTLGAIGPQELLEKARTARPAEELDRAMEVLRAQVPAESLRGVAEAFTLSYGRLPEAARTAARLLAQLAPEPIPMAFLLALGPEVSAPELRSTLVTRSFITKVPGREGEFPLFGRMHRVLADFLRSQATDSARELQRVGKALLRVVSPEMCEDPEAWPVLQLWFPHAEEVHGSLRQQVPALEGSMEANLGMLMANYLAERGALQQARQLGSRIIQRAEATLGREHPDTLAAVGNFALTLRQLGDNATAITIYEGLLEECRRLLGDDDPGTLATMGNLAAALQDEGRLQKALRLKKEVLERSAQTLGPEDPRTLTAMNNLAPMYDELGELDRAFELQERAFLLSLEVLGPEHPNTLLAMSNLAGLCRAQGDLKQGQELQERVVKQLLKSHGPEHPKTLHGKSQLAGALFEIGRHTEALRMMEEVFVARARTLGDHHPDTISAQQFRAKMLVRSGDFDGARKLQEDVLERCLRSFGEGHRETLTAWNELSDTLDKLGLEKETRALTEALLHSCHQHLGADHPGTLGTLARLAEMCHTQGDLPAARELGRKALEAWSRTRGNEDVATSLAAWGHVQVLRKLGEGKACQAVVARHLEWLLERDPATLHPIQQQIRGMLRG